MIESRFQNDLIKHIKEMFDDDCIVLKNDSSYMQGIPDLLILYRNRWAMLECKQSNTSSRRPNQNYFIERLNEMSYANFITPDNMEDVLYEMEFALRS